MLFCIGIAAVVPHRRLFRKMLSSAGAEVPLMVPRVQSIWTAASSLAIGATATAGLVVHAVAGLIRFYIWLGLLLDACMRIELNFSLKSSK